MAGMIPLAVNVPNQSFWFKCPFCQQQHELTRALVEMSPPLGEKPTIDCACGQSPHVPPLPYVR